MLPGDANDSAMNAVIMGIAFIFFSTASIFLINMGIFSPRECIVPVRDFIEQAREAC
jgi:hypothetical protein